MSACEKVQAGHPSVEKDKRAFLGAVKSKADKPKIPELCFKNARRFVMFPTVFISIANAAYLTQIVSNHIQVPASLPKISLI